MVQSTYAPIGLILDRPGDLDEYNVWEVYEEGSEPIAFRLGKSTPFGVKGGLVGSNGSREGRNAVKDYARRWYLMPGHYGEVSHRMLELALEAQAPVICASYVPAIIHKQVIPEQDGVHYRRTLKNVGEVVKVMVGRPHGVPTTSSAHPQCPLPSPSLQGPSFSRPDKSREAFLEHAASLIRL
jgi:hypothetical protein